MSQSSHAISLPNDPSSIIGSVRHVQSATGNNTPSAHSYRVQQRRTLAKVSSNSTLSSCFTGSSSILEFRVDAHQYAIDKVENALIRLVLLNSGVVSYTIVGAFSLMSQLEVLSGGVNVMNIYSDNLVDITFQSNNDMELNNLSVPMGFETTYYTEGITIPAGGIYPVYIPIFSFLQQFDLLGALAVDVTYRLHLNPGNVIYQPQELAGALTAVTNNDVGVQLAELYMYGYKTYGKTYEDLVQKVRGKNVSYKFLCPRWNTQNVALTAGTPSSLQLSVLNGKFSSFAYKTIPAVINANVTATVVDASTAKYGNQYNYSSAWTTATPTYRIPVYAQGGGFSNSYILDSSGTPIDNLTQIPSDLIQYFLAGYVNDSSANAVLSIYNNSFGDYRADTRSQIYNELIQLNGLSNLYFTANANLPTLVGAPSTAWQIAVTGLQASTAVLNADGSLRFLFH